VVFEDNMESNIWKTQGLVFSQRLLHKLIDKGMPREQAYDTVQPLAMKSWEEQTLFKPIVEANNTIQETLTQEEIDEAFDLNHHTRNVDRIFQRVGLE
ncbi:MAG TPA: adenylosuccinate lyase, partial [Balneolaceae bacterium]|nr:adenylosuccinate lyase [Balneolaceae bacterium]